MDTREYFFPYNRIKRGEKVVIVGAGKVGSSFIDQILDSGYCEIAGVIDQAYKMMKEIGIEGFCSVCGETSRFIVDLKSSIETNVNFRERIQCPKCKLNMRMRYLASRLLELYQTGQKVYTYERITSWYKAVSEKIGEENIIGSEYFGGGGGTCISQVTR